jgi:transcriptional regulator with XRE-family HTH domain
VAGTFGGLVKGLRQACGLTLRAFCVLHHLDPGNHSRLERGLLPPPQDEEKLAELARILGLSPGTAKWQEFIDLAAVARGELPKDLLADEKVVEKLPLLFRTLRGTPVPPEQLDDLVEKLRGS